MQRRSFGSSGWLGFLAVSLLMVGCASTPESDEREPAESARDTGEDDALVATLDDPALDGVFVVPGVDFSVYNSLRVPELNLDQWRPAGRELPLKALNSNDRQFFRQTYTESLVHTLVMRGDYALAMDPGPSVLEVRGQLRQAVQSAEEGAGAPRGTIVMLLTLDLYDSVSGDLVATMTSRQPIDRSLNERNSPLTAMQVQRAFLEWMQWFREELDALRQ